MEAVDDGAARRYSRPLPSASSPVKPNGVCGVPVLAAGALRRCYLALPDRPMQLHGAAA
jgi:hypothetical protein